MGAWLAGIGFAYVGARWGLKASPGRIVAYSALALVVVSLLLTALLLHHELVRRPALEAAGHQWMADRGAVFVCIWTLAVAAFLLLGAALMSRGLDASSRRFRAVRWLCRLAMLLFAVCLIAAFRVEDELVFVEFMMLCVPSLLLVRYMTGVCRYAQATSQDVAVNSDEPDTASSPPPN